MKQSFIMLFLMRILSVQSSTGDYHYGNFPKRLKKNGFPSDAGFFLNHSNTYCSKLRKF